MDDWTTENPVDRDAPTKKTGGAGYTVWKAMLELEPYEAGAGPKNP